MAGLGAAAISEWPILTRLTSVDSIVLYRVITAAGMLLVAVIIEAKDRTRSA